MAQEWAKAFYFSREWRIVSKTYMTSKNYVCERCGGLGEVCHHRTYLTPANINDPNISLSFDNLECLCRDCHGKEHGLKRNLLYFDECGNVESVRESKQIKDFKKQAGLIDKLLQRLRGGGEKTTAQNGAEATKRERVD